MEMIIIFFVGSIAVISLLAIFVEYFSRMDEIDQMESDYKQYLFENCRDDYEVHTESKRRRGVRKVKITEKNKKAS